MSSLPTELWIEIFRDVRLLNGSVEFEVEAETSMFLEGQYVKSLLLLANVHREFTAVAQFELFHRLILTTDIKAKLLLKLLRENETMREYAINVRSIRFGAQYERAVLDGGLGGVADELVEYCPGIIEISCSSAIVKLGDFNKFRSLRRLNLYNGALQPDPIFATPSLGITHISIDRVAISEPLNPSSLPFLDSLHLTLPRASQLSPLFHILSQIRNVSVSSPTPMRHIDSLISASTSLTSLCLHEFNIPYLAVESRKSIMERVENLRVTMQRTNNAGQEDLRGIIAGARKMRRLILDGRYLRREDEIVEIVEVLKRECKKHRIEFNVEGFFHR